MRSITQELHSRSFMKSLVWRVLGIVVLAIITYIYTGSLIQTTWITFLHHFIFIFIFYGHERMWLWIGNRITGRKRYIFRAILYEIILGQGVLGLISYLITGSLQTASFITFTYIGNKLWIYVVYDKIWEKYISWGIK